MSGIDIVKAMLAATEAGDFQKAGGMITDDMVFAGPVPEPVGKREFIGMQTAMQAGIPDWKFGASDFKENGNQVTAVMHVSGTQTGELKLPLPGMAPVPATGKHFALPAEPATFTIKDGKVARLETASVPGAGVMGVLAQLGVPVSM